MLSAPSSRANNLQSGPDSYAQDTSISCVNSYDKKKLVKRRGNVRDEHAADAPTKERVQWTPELHEHFLQACEQLGGAHKAKPSEILATMRVPGLSLNHIKSHLQKYRLTAGLRSTDKPQQFEAAFTPAPRQYDLLDSALKGIFSPLSCSSVDLQLYITHSS